MEIDFILRKACSLVGVEHENVFANNQEENVDARAVAFYVMGEIGITDKYIAIHYGISRQCVNKLRNSFRWRRQKWIVRQSVNELEKIVNSSN